MKTVNTMSGMTNHIIHMVRVGIIDLDDFYNVSYGRYSIILQGKYSPDKISDYKEFWTFGLCDVNGFIEGTADIDGIEVRIAFT
jgi:hypothetical protein